jgi:hypothetical protein
MAIFLSPLDANAPVIIRKFGDDLEDLIGWGRIINKA